MLKKILSILLIVAFVGLIPILAGCQDEIKAQQQTEVHDKQVGEPKEAVE